MRLLFGALVLNCMVFFNEIDASEYRRILPEPSRNDRQGVADQALYLGGQQSYYPQYSYPQTPGYQTHSQESLHQESSTGNNYFTNLLRAQIEAAEHGNRVDSLGTSRLGKLPVRMRDSSSRSHDALDLHQYQSYSPQYFQQQIHAPHFYPEEPLRQLNPAETSHLVYKYNFKNGRLPHPRDQQEPDHSQEYSKLGNVEWLVGQTREAELKALYKQSKDEEAGKLVHDGSMRLKKNLLKNKQRSAKQLIEQEMIQEEKPKKQRAVRIREPVCSQNNVEESAMKEHATGEIGRRGKGKVANRKGVSDSRFKAEAAARRNVLYSHDPFIQQSQSSEHHFQNSYPVSIPSGMSAFNPYIRLPQNDPNDPQDWNHPGGSGSNYKK